MHDFTFSPLYLPLWLKLWDHIYYFYEQRHITEKSKVSPTGDLLQEINKVNLCFKRSCFLFSLLKHYSNV